MLRKDRGGYGLPIKCCITTKLLVEPHRSFCEKCLGLNEGEGELKDACSTEQDIWFFKKGAVRRDRGELDLFKVVEFLELF